MAASFLLGRSGPTVGPTRLSVRRCDGHLGLRELLTSSCRSLPVTVDTLVLLHKQCEKQLISGGAVGDVDLPS